MDLGQVYETTIYNRDTDDAFAFATVPAGALPEGVPDVERVAQQLQIEGARIEPFGAWGLPFLIDANLGRFPDFPWILEVPGAGSPRRGELPSNFAQYLAYAPVIPFESSPLSAKSLAELVTTGGGAVGAYATRDPMLLITVPAGIVVCRAAWHVGDGIGIALRTLILRLVGASPPPDEERP